MSTYESDFYGWTQETAQLLRQQRFNEIDLAALIDEVEDMGKSELRALENRLIILMAHLLKWQYQPEHRSNSWKSTIKDQRLRISRLLRENPSLKPKINETIIEAYENGILQASIETNLDTEIFPTHFEQTGWTMEQVLDNRFYPQ
ncbi:DUF29 domain-containing protein [Candidatus Nitrosacidococcus tergens]|uniref:DUF29 domain-containing protein n=1 Tax=Candidatus Nitrosacidococcus tergens TaxID=553981 RepID=A0A7G1QA56_9GAMM|nr:DUF29 domain-containing protein [Candidatus Nitrosacidococcus tergens]CAB1276134.1 conserved protein of unknown function [Candidatus Nitrosacidococcus tergens]